MSTPQIILWVVAIAVGVHSWRWRNPAAVALIIAFAASEAGLSPEYYPWADAFVIAAIMAKFQCSLTDRFILMTYPAAWYFYITDIPQTNLWWWHLFWIAMVQFAAAFAEPFIPYIRRRYAEAATSPPSHDLLLVAFPAGGRSG